MAGPFDPATRDKFHSGMRKMLGYAPNKPVIDPMEEMAARDRERGTDITNPYPVARSSFLKSTGESEVDEAPLPKDTDKPYEGMNFFQAMFTPMSSAAAGREARLASVPAPAPTGTAGSMFGLSPRQAQPAEPMPAPAAGMTASTDTVAELKKMAVDLKLPRTERAEAAAALAFQMSIDAQGRGDSKSAATYRQLLQLAQSRAAQYQALDSAEMQGKATMAQRTLEMELQNQGLTAQEIARGNQTIRVNNALQKGDRESASLATGVADDLAPLVKDPAMSVTEYAKIARNMAAGQQSKTGQIDPALVASTEENAYRQGFRYRAGQYVTDSLTNPMAPEFNANHPRMQEFQNYYRALIKAKPAEYQKIRDDVAANIGGAFATSVNRWAAESGESMPDLWKETLKEMQTLVDTIVGPPPDSGFNFSKYLGFETPQ